MSPRIVAGLLVVAVLTTWGCADAGKAAQPDSLALAKQGIQTFRQHYTRGEFQVIAAMAHPDLTAKVSSEALVQQLQTIKNDLGGLKSAQLKRWNVHDNNGRMEVTLFYLSEFENNTGIVEGFAWFISKDGKTAQLRQYQINPPGINL